MENKLNIEPKISVIMPCYNEQDNISKSIQCILDQTYRNFELIVVDDYSTDDSVKIIELMAQKDSRIICSKNKCNSGVAKSLNQGLKIAKGKYIARMDADDTCEPDRLEMQLKYMETHDKCIVCGTYADVFNGNSYYIQGECRKNIKRELVKNNPLVHSSVLFRRVIDGKNVFYPEIKGFEDYSLWIELSDKGEFHVIDKVLVHRIDVNNFETKKTWEGFTRYNIYKSILHFQIEAVRKNGYYIEGIFWIMISILKMMVCRFELLVKGNRRCR